VHPAELHSAEVSAARQSLALPGKGVGRATLCEANVVFAAGMITNMFP
jgi:hypothetical protein